ncbi:MAG: 50S ribosomal protein L32 [Bacilli bacterium]|nr:50S ribosomal protein L32 [Bacilli bacterium]
MRLDLQLFAVPARRTSKTAKRARRTHLKKDAPTIVKCSNCGNPIAPHRACTKCGFYKGKEVVNRTEKNEK